MAFGHGKDSYLSLDNTSDVLTDISAYVTSIDGFPGDTDTAETTTIGKESKTYIAGLHDASPSIAGIFDEALDDIVGTPAQQKVLRGFEYGPAGNAAGKVKWSGEVLITSYTTSSPVGDIVTFSISLQKSGDAVKGVFA